MSDEPTRGWVNCEFGDVARIRSGYAFKSDWFKKTKELPDDVPLVRQSQLKESTVDLADAVYLPADYLREYPNFAIKFGDILIGMSGSIGKVCRYKDETISLQNQRTGKIHLLYEEAVESRFLGLFLSTLEKTLVEKAKGMGVQNISAKDIENLPFPLPPLPEQKRIVAKIEELFSELEAGETSLRKARRQLGVYRQSLLKQAFEGKLTQKWRTQNPDKLKSSTTLLLEDRREKPQIEGLPSSWEPCYMKDFVSIERGRFSIRPRGDPRYYGGDTPFVQIGDLPREGGTITGYKQTLNEAGLGVSKLFRKGTPLIAIVGATIGNTGILGFDSCCPDSVVALVSYEPITGKFVELYFRAHKDRIRSDSYSSGGQPNINNAYLERQLIGVPSLAEQQEIVRILDEQFEAIERNERELDAALKRSEALRQAILKKAFSGYLVPQDPADEPASQLLARLRPERAGAPSVRGTRKSAVARSSNVQPSPANVPLS